MFYWTVSNAYIRNQNYDKRTIPVCEERTFPFPLCNRLIQSLCEPELYNFCKVARTIHCTPGFTSKKKKFYTRETILNIVKQQRAIFIPENCTSATCAHSCAREPIFRDLLCAYKIDLLSQTNWKMVIRLWPVIDDSYNRQR